MIRIIFLFLLFSTLLFSSIKVDYYNDETSTLNISEIMQMQKNLFVPMKEANLGFLTTPVWLKIIYTKDNHLASEEVFVLKDVRLDFVKVFDVNEKLLYHMGDMLPFISRPFNDPRVSLPLSMLNGDNKLIYYVQVLNKTRMNLEYELVGKADYLEYLRIQNIFEPFFFGTIIIMLIYNLFLFLFLRERPIFDYVIYHSAVLYIMLFYNGAIGQYIFRTAPNLDAGSMKISFAGLCVLLATQFARSFLDTKKIVPQIDKILQIFLLLNFIIIFVDILTLNIGLISDEHHYNHYLFNIIMLLQSVFLLYISIYLFLYKKSKLAFFYFLGWLTMMLGIIVTGMVAMSLIPRNIYTVNLFQVGTLIEVALLSMGLAYRYKLNQDELVKKTRFIHQQSKLASMGEMLGHISHQWRQPLSEINAVAMKIEVDYKKKQLNSIMLDKHIEKIENITEHMSETIDSFNGYFKSDKSQSRVRLEDTVYKTLSLIEESFSKSDIKLHKVIDSQEYIDIVESELIQALLVLLNNAREAFKASHKGIKRVDLSIKQEQDKYLIIIEDNAGGIELDNIDKVFEPYYTSKFESDGIGIGLYMAKMIVEESLKGHLVVQNGKNGAIFTIKI